MDLGTPPLKKEGLSESKPSEIQVLTSWIGLAGTRERVGHSSPVSVFPGHSILCVAVAFSPALRPRM